MRNQAKIEALEFVISGGLDLDVRRIYAILLILRR